MDIIDNQLDKIEKLLKNIDTVNDKMKMLIQAVLGDDTATTDRYSEALEDAQHIQVVLEHNRIEEQEQDEQEEED